MSPHESTPADSPPKKRDLTPREIELRGEAAALIRKHLWLSNTPPPPRNGREWHMGRDLSMWTRLLLEGNDAEEINGAITLVRKITGIVGPMTFTIFYGNGGKVRPIFERSKSEWRESADRAPRHIGRILRDLIADA